MIIKLDFGKQLVMRFLLGAVTALFLTFSTFSSPADAETFSQRFEKGSHDFGAQAGWGYTFDLPPGRDRINIGTLFLFPNWQHNITGLIGESWYQGALFYHAEAGVAIAADRGGNTQWGFSPLMAQYKFLSPERKWAPNILAGAGFSYGDWNDLATREIATKFEFLLHIGAGIEFYNQDSAWSLNYRLWHVSNSGIEFPNIGLNAHIFSLGMRF
ncbi:MAG: acyloxyacyl hydrolase [Nitrospinae bacterium]|nr:acyloxyacyl hydrolase [Nitrospinota bacterium]MZH03985.1 acyloxyacyl hydrolase [Nitrospinota bacterium]